MANSQDYSPDTKINWSNFSAISPYSFKCYRCGNQVSSDKGWFGQRGRSDKWTEFIRICPHCGEPTFFTNNNQFPNSPFGNVVKNISDSKVEELYNEARNSASLNCFTASVLCCRKLLMHIAVAKGAKEKETFAYYVEYLKTKNYVPPDANWVDHIRSKGNEANHEIVIMLEEDAKELILFIEMLLKIIYEFPAIIEKKQTPITEVSN
jgi:hypothetical protein